MKVEVSIRPYQMMCIVCRLGGAGFSTRPLDRKLKMILDAIRENPDLPLNLRCNVEGFYDFQNPGKADDTQEGDLYNTKRDLDIIQRMGVVPGVTQPARVLFAKLLASIPTALGICGYASSTSADWQGCALTTSGNYERGLSLGVESIIPKRDSLEMARAKKESACSVYNAEKLLLLPIHLLCMTCFHGGREKLQPIMEDNLFEVIDVIQKNPEIPIQLVAGCCMICPPCHTYDPKTNRCFGGNSMSLRNQKKCLDILQKIGLIYGDELPARELFRRVYAAVRSAQDICGFGDGIVRSPDWNGCGVNGFPEMRDLILGTSVRSTDCDGDGASALPAYEAGRKAGLGIAGLKLD